MTQIDFDAFAEEHAAYFDLEAQLGVGVDVQYFGELIELAFDAFKLGQDDRYHCALLTYNFVNVHDFLRFNANAQKIELISSERDDPGFYDDSLLQLVMGELVLAIQVRANIFSCELTDIRFKQSRLSINYEIGSGLFQKTLPEVVQTPDCSLVFADFRIDFIESTLPRE